MKTRLRSALLALVACLSLLAAVPPASAQGPGSLDTPFNAGVTGVFGFVLATAVQPDGKIIIGGNFTTVGGAAHANIARLNADGSVDASFTASTDSNVRSVVVQADGKLVLGGDFISVNGSAVSATTGVNRIARLNADGTLDTAFQSNTIGIGGSGANNIVFCLAVQADGKLVLGGLFTSVNGSAVSTTTGVNSLARLNADGTRDTAFNAGLGGANNTVYSVAVQADGKLVLGGQFTSVNGSAVSATTGVNRIARLEATGALDTAFHINTIGSGLSGSGASGIVFSVAVQADGKLVLGGGFLSVNGSTANAATGVNRIARLNADGTRDTAFNSGLGGANTGVYGVAVQADGKLLLGGLFTSVNGSTVNAATGVNFIARLNADGTRDTAFNAGLGGTDNDVYGVAVQVDGMLLLGGGFTSVNGTARSLLARLTNDAATQSLSKPDATQVLWSRSGAGPELSAVTFEQSTNGGTTWTALGAGTRVGSTANWQLTGLSLPSTVSIRARGRTTSGYNSASSGLIEQVAAFTNTGPEIVVNTGTPLSPELTDNTGTQDFGSWSVSCCSPAQTFTITNIGTATLILGTVTLSGPDPGQFSVTQPLSSSLAPTASTTFTITFCPTSAGAKAAVVNIASNDADENPFEINVSGTAVGFSGPVFTGLPITIQSGDYQAGGNDLPTRELDFIPTPGTSYTYIEVTGAGNGILGSFNDLPDGGVVAMNFNGVVYSFQVDYMAGTGSNDLIFTHFTPGPVEWKWTAGPASRNSLGIYGTLHVAAPNNNPGARQGAMNWRALNGNLWMFGGYGHATANTTQAYLNDLWEYDRVTGQWIWHGGASIHNQYGTYGVQGTPAAVNTPGARHTGTAWSDDSGDLWLYGGYGHGASGAVGRLNDLWRYRPSTGLWTWMKGSSSTGAAGVYSGAANLLTPGARQGATGWATSGGNLWLFGGTTNGGSIFHNDLWLYNIGTGNWSVIKGNATINLNGIYGVQGAPAAANTPGARRDATGWVAKDGSLWLFGGRGLAASSATLGDMNDLWRFDTTTSNWTWINGPNTQGAAGTYTALGSAGTPAARSAGSGWVTVDGDFWLVGGFKNSSQSYNDVWIYDICTNTWTWKLGSSSLNVAGVYGTQGVPAAGNSPGARFTPSTWVTLNGALWIFGGGGVDAFGNTGRLSDLWRYGFAPPVGAPPEPAPESFPDSMIVNEAPQTSDTNADTMAYVPVSGQLSGSDADGDKILFSSVGSTVRQGTLQLQPNGQWSYSPAPGFVGQSSFQFRAADAYGGVSSMHTLVITVVTNPADSDNDGLPDAYEQSQLGGLGADPLGDADLDGQSNYFEYLAGTSPADAAQNLSTTPSVTAGASVGGNFKIDLNHVRPGVSYHLESSADLDAWSRIGTFTFNVAGSATIEDPTPPTGQPQFYRISLETSALLP